VPLLRAILGTGGSVTIQKSEAEPKEFEEAKSVIHLLHAVFKAMQGGSGGKTPFRTDRPENNAAFFG
jgi:hypothetical protein